MQIKSRALHVLQSLVDLERETSLPATVRQLAARSGYSSASGIDRYLMDLEDLGALTRAPYTSRSIKSTRKGRNLLSSYWCNEEEEVDDD